MTRRNKSHKASPNRKSSTEGTAPGTKGRAKPKKASERLKTAKPRLTREADVAFRAMSAGRSAVSHGNRSSALLSTHPLGDLCRSRAASTTGCQRPWSRARVVCGTSPRSCPPGRTSIASWLILSGVWILPIQTKCLILTVATTPSVRLSNARGSRRAEPST